jgi:3-deoxy-D-manno-octulosonate 8-phosphate phosphatase (KDO 8-P phosphatase)
MIDSEIKKRASGIKLLLMDCDGVLTDGRITFLPNADEQKTFHVRDGQGIVLLHRVGLRSGIISGRSSNLVERRAKELGINFVGKALGTKSKILKNLGSSHVTAEETAFIGDDIADIPLLMRVGLAIAVADSVPETKRAAHLVTSLNGGFGAVREATDLILKASKNGLI